jgi:hypothetical protein
VRAGGQLDFGNFVDNYDETITDTSTALMWQQGEPGAKSLSSALSYCENLELPSGSGQTDWRLPNIKELESITDDTRFNPAINTTFFPNAQNYYWSSTTYAYYPEVAWGVVFGGKGYVAGYGKDNSFNVRCVRGGQPESVGYYCDDDSDTYIDSSLDGICTGSGCAPEGCQITPGDDCNDGDAVINPGATEICDGIDNDCDGQTDEDVTFYRDLDADGYGDANDSIQALVCSHVGYVTDNTDCNDSDSAINPGAIEICDGIDLNCDGNTDEGCIFTFNLPDTGQTMCYQSVSPYGEISCAGTGQDGAYDINPMSFTVIGSSNDMVQDNNTGLIWQRQDDGNFYNWFQASGTYQENYNPSSQDVCGELTTGGYSDWRLPTKKELMSIVDYSIPYPSPTINPIFTNTKQSYYWSSTTYAGNPYSAWRVYFGYVGVDNYYKSYYRSMYVRCVRGGQLDFGNFVDNYDETITDTSTSLMWQQGEPGAMSLSSALSYCKNLELPTGSGQTDWRLPNIKELESITDDTRFNPAINTTFFPNAQNYYWSSTTFTDNPNYAWQLDFNADGYVYPNVKDYEYMYVRCVRGGQSGSVGYYCDDDSDTYIDSSLDGICTGSGCEPEGCQITPGDDCDDSDMNEHPGQTWYRDADGDGYSNGMANTISCIKPFGYKAVSELTAISGDCNEANPNINPATNWYSDSDRDGYGNPSVFLQQCNQPSGYVLDNTDSNDSDPDIHPGVPDTGQTKCYQSVSPYGEISCAGTGQDGAYDINPMSFTVIGSSNDMVQDNNTRLIWQRQDDGNFYNWFQASGTYQENYNPSSQDVCGELTTGGYSDWRLPTKKELMSIVDYSIPYPGLTINPIFTNTKKFDYWSSTTYAGYLSKAWSVYFYIGSVNHEYKSYNRLYVRCVRGGQLNFGNFANNYDGTITDTSTSLMWQQGEPGAKSLSSALSYCENLELPSGSGQTDWRLPNIKELESITDDTRFNPAINTTFFPNAQGSYRSSTTHADNPVDAFLVTFSDGIVHQSDRDSFMPVRCVRGGQVFDYYCDDDSDTYIDSSIDGACIGDGCVPQGCQTAQGDDCNDSDSTFNPGATEIYDGVDNDCDGTIDEGYDNDSCYEAGQITVPNYTNTMDTTTASTAVDDPAICSGKKGKTVWYKYTAPANGMVSVDTIGSDYDTVLAVYTGTCGDFNSVSCDDDGGGNLTSSVTFEVTAGTTYNFMAADYSYSGGGRLSFNLLYSPCTTVYCQDSDSDGYGDLNVMTTACTQPTGYVADNTDCDDNDVKEHPGQTWYKDEDVDGFSDGTTNTTSCTRPANFKVASELTATSGDSDDNDLNIYPKVRDTGAGTTYYSTLQSAYNASTTGDTIQSEAGTLTENLSLNLNKTITLQGGYNNDYATVTGKTTINGNVIISGGTVTIGDFILQ